MAACLRCASPKKQPCLNYLTLVCIMISEMFPLFVDRAPRWMVDHDAALQQDLIYGLVGVWVRDERDETRLLGGSVKDVVVIVLVVPACSIRSRAKKVAHELNDREKQEELEDAWSGVEWSVRAQARTRVRLSLPPPKKMGGANIGMPKPP